MKKIISVVGARPNFMKVAPIDRAFARYKDKIEHIIVHTGQHYDAKMSDAFFQDLEMPNPKHFLGVGSGSHSEQTAKVMVAFEKVCIDEKPDLVIVVGDVNSTLAAAITAKKLLIPVAHIEAGLRSGDREMPEEINRIATDAIADYLFVTEKSGHQNLINEGKSNSSIFFVGNTMIDSLLAAMEKAEKSNICNELALSKGEYALITLHRPSNVDDKDKLAEFIEIFEYLSKSRKVVFPIHPRTMKNIEATGLIDRIKSNANLHLLEPMGYIDFLKVMSEADFVMTDSGGIQEETTVLGVPCLTLRTTTERPITIEIGTNKLIQPTKLNILRAIDEALLPNIANHSIPELWDGKASERIVKIVHKLLGLENE